MDKGLLGQKTLEINKSQRVQVPSNHLLTHKLLNNYYYPEPKGCVNLLGTGTR